MTSRTVVIANKLGLHARPSAMLVTAAAKFESEIFFTKDSLKVNGKSIMGVMMLAAEKGSQVIIEAEGPDEVAAVDELERVISSRFGEPD